MTLITSCMTKKYVFQFVDWRLTTFTPDFKKILDQDDTFNKCVAVCGQFAISFSGLAKVANMSMDEWLIETIRPLKTRNLEIISKHIANSATEEFRKIQISRRSKQHAFLISGWARESPTAERLYPYMLIVSNALTNSLRWKRYADDEFSRRMRSLHESEEEHICWIGQDVKRKIKKRVRKNIRDLVKEDLPIKDYVDAFISAFKIVAQRNITVSKNITGLTFPREAIGKVDAITVHRKYEYPKDQIVAAYFPDGQDTGERRTPNYIACYGDGFGPIFKDIHAYFEKPSKTEQ